MYTHAKCHTDLWNDDAPKPISDGPSHMRCCWLEIHFVVTHTIVINFSNSRTVSPELIVILSLLMMPIALYSG